MRTSTLPFAALAGVTLAGFGLYACEPDSGGGGGVVPTPTTTPTTTPEASVPDAAPPGTDVSLFYKSGSRLRARLMKGDGLAKFDNFHDNVRNEGCNYTPSQTETPDQMRCVPAALLLGYSDAACTQPAAARDECQTDFKMAVAYVSATNDCPGPDNPGSSVAEIRPLTTTEVPGATKYYYKSDGACQELTMSSNQKLFTLGAPVPLTELAGGKRVREDVGTGLSRYRVMGDDGSQVAIHDFHDRTRNAPCQPHMLGPSTGALPITRTCVPLSLSYADSQGPFVDDGCTQVAGRFTGEAKCGPSLALMELSSPAVDGCGSGVGYTMYQVGAEVASGYRKTSPTTCDPDTGGGGNRRYYTKGAAYPTDPLPKLIEKAVGTGRLRLRHDTYADIQLGYSALYDETLGVSCSPERFADGKLYCLPTSRLHVPVDVHFTDATCTTNPVFLGSRCSPPSFAHVDSPTCAAPTWPMTPLKRIGAEVPAGTTVYFKDGASGACSPLTLAPAQVAYAIGANVTVPELFAEVTQSTE